MERVKNFLKAFITFLGFYLVTIALICKTQMDYLFIDINGEFNAVGKILASGGGESMYYFGFMFIPIIMIGGHLIFGLLEDAEGFGPKVNLVFGLISSLVLVVVQIILRVGFDNYSFYMIALQYPNYELMSDIQLYRTLSCIQLISMGVLGFCIYSFFVSGATYEYIEITTYFDSHGMEINQTESDSKFAIWTHIVLGIATSVAPILIGNTPLIILPFFACFLLLFRHKNKKSLIIKAVACALISVIAITPIVLVDTNVIYNNHIVYQKVKNDNKLELKVKEINYALDTKHITIDNNYYGLPIVEYNNAILKDYQMLESITVPHLNGQMLGNLFTEEEHKNADLAALHIPESLKEIKVTDAMIINEYWFSSIISLEKFIITENTKFIKEYALSGCENLVFNTYENGNYIATQDNPYYLLYSVSDRNITNFKVHEDCVSIAGGAFNYLHSLEYVIVPTNVKHLITYSFIVKSEKAKAIFYEGSMEDGQKMETLNYGFDSIKPLLSHLNDVKVYYYSENAPVIEEGNYWHYDTDGTTPVIWQ